MIIFELILRWLFRVYKRWFPGPVCCDDPCKALCNGYDDARFWAELKFRSNLQPGTPTSQGNAYAVWLLGRGVFSTHGFDIPCDLCGCGQSRHGIPVQTWTPDHLPNGALVHAQLARNGPRTTTQNQPRRRTVDGLRSVEIEDIRVGRGEEVRIGCKVAVEYTGSIRDTGEIFDSATLDAPFVFTLGDWSLIPAWEPGMRKMRVGGIRKFQVPSYMGYGPLGVAGKEDADLEFKVRVLKVWEEPSAQCSVQ